MPGAGSEHFDTVAVIGAGKMAYDCLRILGAIEGLGVSHLVTPEAESHAARRLIGLAKELSVNTLVDLDPNEQSVLEALRGAQVDLIFSINNFRILKSAILDIPPGGVINFHNAPLPRYGGVNIPTWAIWNGENRHGVTWHYVDTGIDTGDIIVQSHFDLRRDETAATLILRCIQEGITLFGESIQAILSGTNPRRAQVGERSYYSRRQIPNAGYLDLSWPVQKLDRFLRALDFRPFPNTLCYPMLKLEGRIVHVSSASTDSETAAQQECGLVTSVTEDSIDLAIDGGRLRIYGIVGDDGTELGTLEAARQLNLQTGSRIDA